MGLTRASLGRDATLNSASITLGAALVRHDLGVSLDGPGASCRLNGLYAARDSQHVDNHTFIDHASPHTTSRQYYKGVVDGESRAVFSGRVLVRPGAQHADAQQTNRNLVLSQGAEVDTKPSLQIFADDVRCSHGATAGPLAGDAVLYLRSRGPSEGTARWARLVGILTVGVLDGLSKSAIVMSLAPRSSIRGLMPFHSDSTSWIRYIRGASGACAPSCSWSGRRALDGARPSTPPRTRTFLRTAAFEATDTVYGRKRASEKTLKS